MPTRDNLGRHRRSAAHAFVRAVALLAHVLYGLWIVWWFFPRWNESRCARRIQTWSVQALRILGVVLHVQGQPPACGPLLVVANHVSWLDILAINAARPCRFVAKADVQRWPLLGQLVTRAGTLFVARERKRDAVRVMHHLAQRLRAGDVLAIFPEGTTNNGCCVLPFHANLLQAALATGAPVQPLGVAYLSSAAASAALVRHEAPVYVGNTTLLASVWRVLRVSDVVAHLHWGVPEMSDGRDRRTWAAQLRAAVAALAGVPESPVVEESLE